MIRESIHVSIHEAFLTVMKHCPFMYRDTRFSVFKNRLSTIRYWPMLRLRNALSAFLQRFSFSCGFSSEHTFFCKVLTVRHRAAKDSSQQYKLRQYRPKATGRSVFVPGAFYDRGVRALGCAARRLRRPPLHLPFASPKERRKRRRQDPPPASLLPFPIRLDNRNGKVKTHFGGEGMLECGK